MHYIYKITVIESEKCYVGCTSVSVESRIIDHRYKKNEFVILPHTVEILETTEDYELSQKIEAYYIGYFDSANPEKGYNRRLGGSKYAFPEWVNHGYGKRNNPRTYGMLGKHHTPESKEKLSKAHIGVRPLLGIKLSEEMKRQKALKRAGKGYIKGKDHYWFGKHKTEEQKQKLREFQIERQKLYGNNFSGKKHSEETRLKMKKAWEKRILRPSTRIGKIHNEETKQKMKKAWELRRLKMKTS